MDIKKILSMVIILCSSKRPPKSEMKTVVDDAASRRRCGSVHPPAFMKECVVYSAGACLSPLLPGFPNAHDHRIQVFDKAGL